MTEKVKLLSDQITSPQAARPAPAPENARGMHYGLAQVGGSARSPGSAPMSSPTVPAADFTIFPGDAVEIMECLATPHAAKK